MGSICHAHGFTLPCTWVTLPYTWGHIPDVWGRIAGGVAHHGRTSGGGDVGRDDAARRQGCANVVAVGHVQAAQRCAQAGNGEVRGSCGGVSPLVWHSSDSVDTSLSFHFEILTLRVCGACVSLAAFIGEIRYSDSFHLSAAMSSEAPSSGTRGARWAKKLNNMDPGLG